ncbi:MAG: hypothetical protein DHS20C07_13100 [Methyloligella sp.]|nr:MAG: hypothetical protein DHS20C07_13100 [Methyloligella sp.]
MWIVNDHLPQKTEMSLIVITPNMTNITIRSKLPKIKSAKEMHEQTDAPIKKFERPRYELRDHPSPLLYR